MKRILLVCSVLWLTGASPAQETLTIEKAVNLALEQNNTLRAARYGAESATWGVRNSYTNFLPRVQLAAGVTRIDPESEARANAAVDFIRAAAGQLGIPPSALSEIKPFAYRDTYQTDLIVVQPVYNGGAEIAGVRAAGAMDDRARYSMEDTEQEVVTRVKTAYCNVLKTQGLVELARESAARMHQWLELTEKRETLGQRTKTDVLRFRVQLAAEEGNIVNAENALAMSRIQLNELMGGDLQKVYTLRDVVPADSGAASGDDQPLSGPLASLALLPQEGFDDSFLENHPSMKMTEAGLRLADIGVSQAWTRFQPNVNLAFQYGWEKNNTLKLDGIRPWAVSLSVQWPIFNSFGDYTNLQKAQLDAERAREEVESFKRGLLMQSTNAALTLKATGKRIEIARAGLQEAQDVLNSVARRYDLGAASNVDLIDVQTAYTSAKTAYISAVYDNYIARVQLERATGVITR